MASRRIADEPAYVLHRYDWSESSLILEVFTRHHGRLVLAAKGVKRPTSSFRPILLPLQPLAIAFGGEGDVRTLKAAEWVGGHVMPTGEALLSGYYLNELVMRLLAREDPHIGLFDIYAAVVRLLVGADAETLQWALRAFELLLLRELGLLPALHIQTLSLQPLVSGERYTLLPEAGLQQLPDSEPYGLAAAQWLALQQALDQAVPLMALLQDCTSVLAQLQRPLRQLLNYHCGVETLRTRQMMLDLQSL
jgi:DNA repair protein RecO (recombination protein O)